MKLDAKEPSGPIADKWDRHKFEMKLVNPANKRKYTIIVVGTGLAGGSAAASLGFYHPRYSPWLSRFGYLYAVIIAAGFLSQPIYVYFLR